MKSRRGWLTSVAAGAALWTVATVTEGNREPWDGENYFSLWLPTAFLLSAVLGFLFPERPWRWPLALMLMQMPIMAVLIGQVGPLIGVGLIFLLAYSLPGMLAAWLGTLIRRWRDREKRA